MIAPEDLSVKGPIFSLLWGRDPRLSTVAGFLGKVDADWLITGHLHPETGFAINGEQHIILDSSASPAAFCLLPANRTLTASEFQASIQLI